MRLILAVWWRSAPADHRLGAIGWITFAVWMLADMLGLV